MVISHVVCFVFKSIKSDTTPYSKSSCVRKLKTPLSGWCRLHGTYLQATKMFPVNVQPVISNEKQNTSTAVLLRSEGVDATGLHFQQAVPPVGPGHTEIVDGSPKDLEGLSLQGELG